MSTQDAVFLAVFVLFGFEVLTRFGQWFFAVWRDIADLREWLHSEDEPVEAASS